MVSYSTTSYHNNADSQAIAQPINLARNGFYLYNSGSISSRSSDGRYWQLGVASIVNARHLTLGSTTLYPQNNNYYKGYGFSLRCLVR